MKAPALQALFSFEARNKVGRSATYGFARFGHARFGFASRMAGVYQIRHNKGKQLTVRMRYYRGINPQTVPQQANRTKFTNAMIAWGNLTNEERAEYTIRAKKRQMFGHGLFIREFYQAN